MKLKDILEIRTKIGITQSELSRKSGVSQSIIAKIEAGKVDPTFSNVQRIFSALKSMKVKDELTAKEILNKKVYTIKLNDSIKSATKLIKKYYFSQIPVMKDKKIVGLITEDSILNNLPEDKKDLDKLKVKNFLIMAPPLISFNTKLSEILELIKYNNSLLVLDEGELKGIITKSDIIKSLGL
jgi:predicted transcriptional regulator